MNQVELKRSNQEVKALLGKTFPAYSGRKIKVRESDTYHLEDYWSGGTRRYVVAFNLTTSESMPTPGVATNPFNKEAHQEFPIPDGCAIVEHVIFCGKDIGIIINVNANTFPKMLPEGQVH